MIFDQAYLSSPILPNFDGSCKKSSAANLRSARHKRRIPNSILQVGASIDGKYDYVFVDGDLELDPWEKIRTYLATGEFGFFGSPVMPRPQPISRADR